SDDVGPGAVQLQSIGCPIGADVPQDCRERYSVTFTALTQVQGGQPVRQLLTFFVEEPAGSATPGIVMTVLGGGFPQDPNAAEVAGGTANVIEPKGFPPFGTFIPAASTTGK